MLMEPFTGPTDLPSTDTEQAALFDPPSGDEAHEENAVTQEEADPTSRHQCCFCQRRVDPGDPDTYEEVTSWVHGKKKDSAVLRTRNGRLACGDCISKMRAGMAVDQQDYETLLDGDPERADVDGIFSDRSESYYAGYSAGLSGNSSSPPTDIDEIDSGSFDWDCGYADGEEYRIAKERLGTPLSEQG